MPEQIMPQQNISLSGVSGGGEIDIYTYFTASPYFAGFTSHNSPDMKIFLGLYQTLPDSLRQFIASDETALTIFTTGQSYNLDDEQIFVLAKSIRELVTGNVFIKDFPITISSKLGIDDIKAGEIANKIISKSFGPIIEDVKRIQRSKFPDKISQIQKESRPGTITRPAAQPDIPRPQPQAQAVRPPLPPRLEVQPLNKSAEVGPRSEDRPLRPEVGLPKPPEAQLQRPVIGPQSQPPPLRSVESILPPRLEVLPQRSEVGLQKPAPRPQFKMPDLGPLDLARDKQPMIRESSPQVTAPRSDLQGRTDLKSTDAQKSLEQELEKVAGVIDLRNKPKE